MAIARTLGKNVSMVEVRDYRDAVLEAARSAREKAYAPYSRFRMGAAVLTESGEIVPGALVENVSLGLAMCAERAALFAAVARGAGKPILLALVAPRTDSTITYPCGACLQVALELGGADVEVMVSDLQANTETSRLADLAPRLPAKNR